MRPKPGSEGTTGDRQVNSHQWDWGRFVIAIGVWRREIFGDRKASRAGARRSGVSNARTIDADLDHVFCVWMLAS